MSPTRRSFVKAAVAAPFAPFVWQQAAPAAPVTPHFNQAAGTLVALYADGFSPEDAADWLRNDPSVTPESVGDVVYWYVMTFGALKDQS